jgi:hypothetical protein
MSAATTRQLNINLPENMLKELQDMARNSSMEDVVRRALVLVKIASDATENKQKLLIADQSGRTIKEIILPK